MRFLENMSFGQYIPADSLIHRLDPRTKILGLVLLLTGVFQASVLFDWLLWIVVFVICARLSHMRLAFLMRSIRTVFFLILFTAGLNVMFGHGEPVFWEWGIFTVTAPGIELACKMSLRLSLLVLFTNLMTLTTSPMALSDGLEKLLSPLKKIGFPAQEMAMMMTIALRFIPTLFSETERIMKAQLSRGADLDRGTMMQRVKAFVIVMVPLFMIVFQRADELAVAMEARCYRGDAVRSRMNPFQWQSRDSVGLICCVAMLCLQIILRRIVPGFSVMSFLTVR